MKNKFKERLRECRLAKGLTQKQLAEALGLSRSNINDYEWRGLEPNYDTLIKMAIFFDESIDYLLGLID